MLARTLVLLTMALALVAVPTGVVDHAEGSLYICTSDDPVEDVQCTASQVTSCIEQALEHGACRL